MRMFLIATVAAAALTAGPVGAQTFRHGGNAGGGHAGGGQSGGHQSGGQWSGGGHQSGGQWSGGGWSGGSWSGGASASAQGGGGGWSGGGWSGQHWGGGRWGGNIGGHWYGGVRAPGGWDAYRRPQRGWAMPGYWRSPAWAITDWQYYGLGAPPAGYGWSRYYDDAVLVDGRGYVYDSVGGLDWRRADQPYASGYGYPSQGYYNGQGDAYRGVDPRCYKAGKRKGSGIGGAIVGGAIGAAVGAATGGLGTTLLVGGLGALGGQAIDRNSRDIACDDGRRDEGARYDSGPDYGAGEDAYSYRDGYYEDGQRDRALRGPPPSPPIVDHGYGAGVTRMAHYGGPVSTTTTIVTTVTEEWIYPAKRKVVRKWKPRSKVRCIC